MMITHAMAEMSEILMSDPATAPRPNLSAARPAAARSAPPPAAQPPAGAPGAAQPTTAQPTTAQTATAQTAAAQAAAAKMFTELKTSAHLMTFDAGLYCVVQTPAVRRPDDGTGLPGVRISLPPLAQPGAVSIVSFRPDGWMSGASDATLIRVMSGPAQVLVTIYQAGCRQRHGAAPPGPAPVRGSGGDAAAGRCPPAAGGR